MKERKPPVRDAQTRALGLLARREHSRRELRRKLVRSGHDDDEVDTAITRLDGTGLQSDERFAEVLVRSRIAQGQGPVRIAAELRQHGLGDSLIQQALEAGEPDWPSLALDLYRRRFRSPAGDHAERARRARFLLTRGFPSAMARACLELDPADHDGDEDLD